MRRFLAPATLALAAATGGCLFSADLEEDTASFVFGNIARAAFLNPPAKVPKSVKRTEQYAYAWIDLGETSPGELTLHLGRVFGDPEEKQIAFVAKSRGPKRFIGSERNTGDLKASLEQILSEMTEAAVVVKTAKLVANGRQIVAGEDWKVSLLVSFAGTADGKKFTGTMKINDHATGIVVDGG